jgi:hypothetical protein
MSDPLDSIDLMKNVLILPMLTLGVGRGINPHHLRACLVGRYFRLSDNKERAFLWRRLILRI